MQKLTVLAFLVATSIAIPLPNPQSAHERSDFIGISTLSSKSLQLQNLNNQLQLPKTVSSYPDFRPFGREEAVLEQEHWLSKIDSVYERAQGAAARILMPKPIVDTIQEHEKYGNDGEKYRQVATAIVNGYDAIGNVANTLVDFPFKAKGGISKTVNAALNAIGGTLVGI